MEEDEEEDDEDDSDDALVDVEEEDEDNVDDALVDGEEGEEEEDEASDAVFVAAEKPSGSLSLAAAALSFSCAAVDALLSSIAKD